MDMTYEEYMDEPFHMWFNGIDLSDYFIVAEVQGRSLSSNDLDTIELPKQDGFHLLGKRKLSTPLKVTAILIEESETDLRVKLDELNGILNTEEAAPIEFTDEPDMTYNGMLRSVAEVNEVRGNHITTLIFSRPDVYKIGQEVTRPIDGTQFNYVGTYKTFPVITSTFDSAASSFEVSNQDGLKVKVNYEFQTGDELELDFRTQKITVNGNVQMTALAWTISDWFAIKQGSNTLTATNPADMTYEEKWL